jgi:nitrogen fixation NifU-like protein
MSNVRNLEEIYKEIILDHYSHPRGCKDFDNPSIEEKGHNVSCGDKVEVKVKVSENEIKDFSVCSKGCAICVSSGSIMYGLLKNNNIEDAKEKVELIIEFIKGEKELDESLISTTVNSLAGIRKFPARLKCALLPWITAKKILNNF